MLSAPGTITIFTAQLSASCQVGSGVTSLSRFPAHLGDNLGTSHLAVGFLLVFSFPLEMEWILATKAQCPLLLPGQNPPALLWCVMVWHTAWCQPVSHTANVISLLQFFSGEKFVSVWLLMLATGRPTCASWWWCWCLLNGGWLALSSSSWVLCLWALGSVHLPWAPHWCQKLGCCGFTTPFGRGGSCPRPITVDKQLNRLTWYKTDGSFILSSCISVQVKVYKGVYPGVYKQKYTKRGRGNKRGLYNIVRNTLSK